MIIFPFMIHMYYTLVKVKTLILFWNDYEFLKTFPPMYNPNAMHDFLCCWLVTTIWENGHQHLQCAWIIQAHVWNLKPKLFKLLFDNKQMDFRFYALAKNTTTFSHLQVTFNCIHQQRMDSAIMVIPSEFWIFSTL